MEKVGLALVGAGEVAQNFHLPALKNINTVNINAICDKNFSLARAVAERYNIPYVYRDVSELLKNDEVDAVDICTSTDAHLEVALASMESGRDIFIEKPVARNLSETQLIAETAVKNNIKAMVDMNHRFRSDAIMMKNFVSTGEIGEIFYAKAAWLQQKRSKSWVEEAEKSGGGVLFDLGITMIDSLLWAFDFIPLKSVHATMFNHLTKNVEDVCIGSLRFANGSIATFETSWTLFSSRTNFQFDIHGSKGVVTVNPLVLLKSNGVKYSPVPNVFIKNDVSILRKSFEGALKHFLNSVRGIVPVISTIAEAVKRMKVIEALYQSAKEGREINLI
jgi:predicted dehydrogenase